jgi:hypothetical protein
MLDKVSQTDSLPPSAAPSMAPAVRRSPAWRIWLIVAAIGLLAGGAIVAVRWSGWFGRPVETPLDGKLVVAVRAGGPATGSLLIEEPDALPVRAGGSMSLEVHFNQPAYTYLVWLDCQGKVVPLYPWNMDEIEVTDVNEPPPLCSPTHIVFNPVTIGQGWKFGNQGGLETVLLLARRTPLSKDVRLGTLLAPLPPAKMRLGNEWAVLTLPPGTDSLTTLSAANRGPEEVARAADEPLRKTLLGLRDHFELIRAVRFAHEGE